MRKSGEARIFEKILDVRGRIIYDQGGAVVVEFSPNNVLNYFFIGKHSVKYTGEPYYVTIAVHEFKNKLRVKGKAKIKVRKGFLGIGSRIWVEKEGGIGEIVDVLIKTGIREELYKTPYEEIVVKCVDKEELPGNVNVGQALVVIGRTGIAHTLFPEKYLRKIFVFNIKFMEKILKFLNQ